MTPDEMQGTLYLLEMAARNLGRAHAEARAHIEEARKLLSGKSGKTQNVDFFEAMKKYYDGKLNDGSMKRETHGTYVFTLSKLAKFRPTLKAEDLTRETMLELKRWMEERGNCQNTIKKTLLSVRTIAGQAKKNGLPVPDSYNDFRVGKIKGRREFLTTQELMDLYHNFLTKSETLGKSEYDAMCTFLFSCFTGLRFSDLRTLSSDDIVDGKICKEMCKTGQRVYVPLSEQAKILLEMSRGRDEASPKRGAGGLLMVVTENTYFNRHIRSAAEKLGCKKHLYCHLARHTFATLCLSSGIPLEVTSKLLGHSEIRTTQIYAKFTNILFDREILKLNQVGETA